YAAIREACLLLYGPPMPVGFFRHRIFSIRGATREEVLPPMEDALALHNRAARDEGRPEWSDWDLIYPFIGAFPDPVREQLKNDLRLVQKMENPFRELVSRAPTKETMTMQVPLVAMVTPATDNGPLDVLVAAVDKLSRQLDNPL